MDRQSDYLVIGAGIGGLSFALKAAERGRVLVLAKAEVTESNTRYAQGGIAAVWDEAHDSFEEHVADTLTAGAGMCRLPAVELTVRSAPAAIQELIGYGVQFSRSEGGSEYDLGREGGHSQRRILHAKDLTGQEVVRALVERALAHPNITFLSQQMAIDLITTRRLGMEGADRVLGAYVYDVRSRQVGVYRAPVVVLATGGLGKVYRYTSNPDVATGDGVAMAYRAGAAVANMEFVQFHPTCLFHPHAKSFLISEAVRGEGARLITREGVRFMEKAHPMGELAPRDIVARAIDAELKRSGADCVYLDITHRDAAWIKDRFPGIYGQCLRFGIDITQAPIPVVPAAHYACGGVRTDLDGQTNIANLYAIGEVASTGLHGANRLASNSLLEALVFANQAIHHVNAHPVVDPGYDLPSWNDLGALDSDEEVVVSHNWDEVRSLMWNYVGIVRTDKRLHRALRRIELLQQEIRSYYWEFRVTGDLIELRNLALVAELIIRSALARKESRGLHTTLDYPELVPSEGEHDTVLVREHVSVLKSLGVR